MSGPPAAKPYRKLGELLLAAGVIDELQLQSALAHQRQWGGRIGHILLDLHFIDDLTLASTLAEQLGLELINLRTAPLDSKALQALPQSLAERLLVFPVRAETNDAGTTVTVAFSDPTNLAGMDEIRFQTGKAVQAAVATEGEVAWAIRRFYYGEEDTEPVARPPEEVPARAELFGDGKEILGGSEEDELVELEPIPSDSQIGEAPPGAFATEAAAPEPLQLGSDPLREFFTPDPAAEALDPGGFGTTQPPVPLELSEGGSVLEVEVDLQVTSSEGDDSIHARQDAAQRPTRRDVPALILGDAAHPIAVVQNAGPAVAAELDAAFERTFTLRGGTPDPSMVMTAPPLDAPVADGGSAEPPVAGLSGQALQALIRILVRKGLVSEVEILDELQAAASEVGEVAPTVSRPLPRQ